MGYLFLGISLLCGAAKGFCGKKSSGYLSGYKESTVANILRMLLCIIIGIFFIISSGSLSYIKPNPEILCISALSGVTTSVFVVCWMLSVKKGAYMMLDVFLMLGVLVPIIGGKILYNEVIRLNQWLGIAMLLVAVLIMCSYNNSIKEKITFKSLTLLILCGLANGLTDFSQKIFVKKLPETPISIFNFYTYVFSATVLIIFYFFINSPKKCKTDENPLSVLKKIFGYVLIMSLCLFAHSYFKTASAVYLDSAQLYPLNQGCALILSSVMSAVFFHEKLSSKCIAGLLISFAALVVINIL